MVPTEDWEQTQLVKWLDAHKYKYFRVPNETYTKSWKQRAKNKRLGVKPGVPDLFVIAGGKLVAIEMKRVRGSSTSQAQKDWIDALNAAGVTAVVCKGHEQAERWIIAQGRPPVYLGKDLVA